MWGSDTIFPEIDAVYDCSLEFPELRGADVCVSSGEAETAFVNIGIDGRVYFREICQVIAGSGVVISFGGSEILLNEVRADVSDTIRFSFDWKEIMVVPV